MIVRRVEGGRRIKYERNNFVIKKKLENVCKK